MSLDRGKFVGLFVHSAHTHTPSTLSMCP